jgi:hypothetical protein
VLSIKLGTRGEKTRSNHDVSDLQVGAIERSPRFRLGIPSWMTIETIFFPVGARFFPELTVVLNALKSEISEFPVVLNAPYVLF